jgi:integrase
MKQEAFHINKLNHYNSINSTSALPIWLVYDTVGRLEYASVVRVMFLWQFYTGCRMAELPKMNRDKLIPYGDHYLQFWELGKNQREKNNKKHRKEIIPNFVVEEMLEMQKKERCYSNKVFPIKHTTYRRYFNKSIKPTLHPAWKEQAPAMWNGEILNRNKYCLSSLRKTFATLYFYWVYFQTNSLEVALMEVSKRMNHKTKEMTYHHYLKSVDQLELSDHKIESVMNFSYKPRESQKSLLNWAKC